MPIVEDPASEAQGHARGHEGVKGESGHPIYALLPPVLRLVVFVAKPFESNLQQSRGCKKEQITEVHFAQVCVSDCFMMTSAKEALILYSYLPPDSTYTVLQTLVIDK